MNEIRLPSVEKPWLKIYGDEACASQIPKQTLYEHFHAMNDAQSQDTALIFFDNYISYQNLFDEIEKAASAFAAIGVKKGDVVAYCTLSTPEAVVCLYALNKLGAALMLLDPRRSAEEIKKYVVDGNIKYLLVLNVFYDRLTPVIKDMNLKKLIVTPIGRSASPAVKLVTKLKFIKVKPAYSADLLDYDDFLKLGEGIETKMAGFDEFELAAITFSGGTTGIPKGVMLSNYGINAVTDSMRNSKIALTNNHRYLTIIPVFTSYGLVCGVHMPLCLHDDILLIAKPEPEKLGKIYKKYKPAHTTMVPGFYEKFINSREMADPNTDLSYITTAGCGGDTMSEGLEKRVNEFLAQRGSRQRIAQGYGMSEMTSAATACCKGRFKDKSVGFPMLHTVGSVFEPGTCNELSYNQIGEICLSGENIMMGYFNNQEETDKILLTHPDGTKWIHSGDLGYMDEEGFIYISGRIKRTIPRPDGHKVLPVEIENTVSKTPNVLECACVGAKIKGLEAGEYPVVVITVKDPSLAEETKKAVIENCKKYIEFRSQPKNVQIIEAFPYIGMGKIDYNRVKANYLDACGPVDPD